MRTTNFVTNLNEGIVTFVDQTEEDETSQGRDRSQSWRRGSSRSWLTSSILERFDLNRNGRLESHEARSLGIPSGQIDIDQNGELSRDEVQTFLTDMQDKAGDVSEGLPGWFYELDTNQDRQVELSEFATLKTNRTIQEFISLDTNGDGLLTSSEVTQSKAMVGGSYHNQNGEVLPPRKTIISEIEVSENYVIGDLNVQISITHSNTSWLDAFLTGPDGQRIELFTEVGGSGNNFEQTVLDDQSRSPITKARSPFTGTFMPEALAKRQPSLSHFNGKNINGVWQLVVRGTRNERFGMLHGWSLIVKPQERMPGSTTVIPLRNDSGPGVKTSSSPPQNQRTEAPRVRAPAQSPTYAKTSLPPLESNKTQAANFEEQLQKKKLSPEDIAKYKKRLEKWKRPKDKMPRKAEKFSGGKDPMQRKKLPDSKKLPETK